MFESRRSRKIPANRHVVLSGQTLNCADYTDCSLGRSQNAQKRAKSQWRYPGFEPIHAAFRPATKAAWDYTKRPEVKARHPSTLNAGRGVSARHGGH
jgi:hypothetical protein